MLMKYKSKNDGNGNTSHQTDSSSSQKSEEIGSSDYTNTAIDLDLLPEEDDTLTNYLNQTKEKNPTSVSIFY